MKRSPTHGLILLILLLAPAAHAEGWSLASPEAVLGGIPFTVTVDGPTDQFPVLLLAGALVDTVQASGDLADRRLDPGGILSLMALDGTVLATTEPRILPGWTAVLPPLLAIALHCVAQG